MYFNDKSDTNIDSEFKGSKKNFNFNFDFGKWKWPLVIVTAIILLVVVIIIVASNSNKYTLQLKGDSEISIYQGDEYIELGFMAYDKKGNDVSDKVSVSGEVNTEVIGQYTVTYTLGKKVRKRYVSVVEKPEGAAFIHILSDEVVYLKVGDTYVQPEYLAQDTVDGDIKDNVKIESNVDTSKPGTYTVIYSVVNSSGVTVTAKRTVIVSK